ncbi:MAG: hypothetical protein IJ917_10705 [Firmicutes bacterium]|nr:hypothetical protein [Bacillota bacterium]
MYVVKEGRAMQYLFTERAHLMCPNMCFGIVMVVSWSYNASKIRATIAALTEAHPFLKAVLKFTAENKAYYHITERSQVELLLQDQEVRAIDDASVMAEYERLTSRDWNLLEDGLLKVAAWPMGGQTCFLLVFHHLLADGRGALGLAQELADHYALGVQPHPVEEQLIASKQDMPADSELPFISRTLVRRANKTWVKEKQKLTYQAYHACAEAFLEKDVIKHEIAHVPQEELDQILKSCHEHEVTLNDYLLAEMMIKEGTEKVIMACDLRERLPKYKEGALGNYSTAFSVVIKQKKKDLFVLAKAVHKQVRKIMEDPSALWLVLQCYADLDPGLLDAAWISCQGDFPSKAGKFIGSMFFGFTAAKGHSITNLGRMESRSITEGFFIPPASPAIKKTLGVLTVNGTMTVCSSER